MKKILTSIVFALMIFMPGLTLAQQGGGTTQTQSPSASPLLNRLQNVGAKAGYDSGTTKRTALEIVGTVINVALSLLGVIFIILILVAGFNWMTADGDEEKIKKAGATIRAAIIGLLIIASAFAIWLFVSNVLIGGNSSGTGTFTGS